MVLERVCAINVLGVTERIFGAGGNFGPVEKRKAIGLAIAQVGDLLISGPIVFIACSERLALECGAKVFGGSESIWLWVGIRRPRMNLLAIGIFAMAHVRCRV